ncbi:MAG: lysoplasmalogenase [Desulfobacterales bacterium]
MTGLWILGPAAALLAGLLFFEKRELRAGMVPAKGILSALFVATAALQPWPLPAYAGWITAGLCLSLAGDVMLALPGDRPFLLGLVSFLAGHGAYVVAFFSASAPPTAALAALVPVGAVSLAVYRWLRPHLGAMKGPVIAYIAVISLMLAAAAALFRVDATVQPVSATAFFGALAFYLSDLFVARDRFVKTEFFNRLIGLPLYYTGQFLLAYSTGIA